MTNHLRTDLVLGAIGQRLPVIMPDAAERCTV